jgi:cell division protein FtsB
MPSTKRDPGVPSAPRRKPRPPTTPTVPLTGRRKTLQLLLVFVTLVLIINALIGERGLKETLRAREKHTDVVTAIERLRAENARLREDAARLRSDPGAIEAVARQELGLIKPGEILFIIKDAKPSATANQSSR